MYVQMAGCHLEPHLGRKYIARVRRRRVERESVQEACVLLGKITKHRILVDGVFESRAFVLLWALGGNRDPSRIA
jgi:hypothetical protein